tara:strand:- start:1739 stop:2596 length:858 start_codon:yes stop_codon:yes gene_type:complete
MHEINLFCFGFGQVAKSFINNLIKNKLKINLITTSRQKTGEYTYSNLKYINYNFHEKSFDKNLIKEISKFSHILISTPPINSKDLFLELLNLNYNLLSKSKWITYLSSTSVYGDHKGAWVSEDSKLTPISKKGTIRLEIENRWKILSKDYPIQIFRLAGIYSKEQNLITRIKKNNMRIIMKKDHKFSRIHLEDISGFLLNSLKNFKSGEIYNIADDKPISNEEVLYEILDKYALKPPAIIDYEDLEDSTLKEFYLVSKKVKNNKAKDFFNYKLIYPTIREGLNLL